MPKVTVGGGASNQFEPRSEAVASVKEVAVIYNGRTMLVAESALRDPSFERPSVPVTTTTDAPPADDTGDPKQDDDGTDDSAVEDQSAASNPVQPIPFAF